VLSGQLHLCTTASTSGVSEKSYFQHHSKPLEHFSIVGAKMSKSVFRGKHFRHFWQRFHLFSSYVRKRQAVRLSRENCFPHCRQGDGFSLVCARRWSTMLSIWEKHFPYCWQGYSCSPVCMQRWITMANPRKKTFYTAGNCLLCILCVCQGG